MKKVLVILLLAAALCGCQNKETFETVDDVYEIPAPAPMGRVMLVLPGDAAAMTMDGDQTDQLYFCGDAVITVQILESGDLNRTIRAVTGFERDALTVVQTEEEDLTRYDFVWHAAGEGGDELGKAAVLDDGNYHYVLSVMAPADQAGSLTEKWGEMFNTFYVA